MTEERQPSPPAPAPAHACREGCGACCIAPSISSPIPGMPDGKPAGVPCAQLDENFSCRIFGRPERPAVCASLRPGEEMCGDSRSDALARLTELELLSDPGVR
ncbi:MAG: YkgJ family cysteine cluster protein [Victivallaceae bacterium]